MRGQTVADDVIQRDWATGPNAARVLQIAAQAETLRPLDARLFCAGLALEEGDLPWIEQYGFARFDGGNADHRIIKPQLGVTNEQETTPSETTERQAREATVDPGSSTGRATSPSEETATWPSPWRSRADYRRVADVVEEDTIPIARYFPQFSTALWDPQLQWWYRQGWLHPLRWWPARFGVQLCYELHPMALPILRISPELHPRAPHMWQHTRHGLSFRSICYTFAPDGTIVRGRTRYDNGAEVLRQAVVWLCRYLVWLRFRFWPGVDVGHDPATIERETRPSDPCPVHPHRRYGACCRKRVLKKLAGS